MLYLLVKQKLNDMRTHKENFKLMGIKLPTKTSNLNNQSSKDCGNLWQQFEKKQIIDLIPGKLSNEVYAVYFEYEKDEAASFSYFIGCKVREDVPTIEGLDVLEIPSQTYLKYIAKGKMTDCITDTWKEIWNSKIDRKFAFDFEVYGEKSQDWNDAEVDIFVSIS